MRTSFRFHGLRTSIMLFGMFVICFCPFVRAQVASPEEASDDTAPTSSGTPESSSSSQTQSQPPGNISLSNSQTVRRGCDLASAPLACLTDISRDQRGIWTAPARLRGRKALWLAPFAAATGLALGYDVSAMNALGPSATRVRVSNDFTHLGSGYTLVGAAGLTYLFGKLEHKEGPREAGMLALESIADTTLVVEGLKFATNRERPYVPPGRGGFWPDDVYTLSSSFPSGHSAATWAVARVMVEETPGHPWLHVLFYGLATGVSIGRVTGQNHFPSDALVGSIIGYMVGGFVYHRHSDLR